MLLKIISDGAYVSPDRATAGVNRARKFPEVGERVVFSSPGLDIDEKTMLVVREKAVEPTAWGNDAEDREGVADLVAQGIEEAFHVGREVTNVYSALWDAVSDIEFNARDYGGGASVRFGVYEDKQQRRWVQVSFRQNSLHPENWELLKATEATWQGSGRSSLFLQDQSARAGMGLIRGADHGRGLAFVGILMGHTGISLEYEIVPLDDHQIAGAVTLETRFRIELSPGLLEMLKTDGARDEPIQDVSSLTETKTTYVSPNRAMAETPSEKGENWAPSFNIPNIRFGKELGVGHGDEVVVIGSSSQPQLGLALASLGAHVRSVDLSAHVLEELLWKLKRDAIGVLGGQYEIQSSQNYLDVKLQPSTQKVVIALAILDDPETKDPKKIIEKMFNDVKEGGYLIFGWRNDTKYIQDKWSDVLVKDMHWDFARENGFEIRRIEVARPDVMALWNFEAVQVVKKIILGIIRDGKNDSPY